MKLIGIYIITNLINNKKYVGQSSDINSRWTHHKIDLRNNTHHNYHLQYAWNKYGEDNFLFNILELCNVNNLNDRESYWINYYDSVNNGYNLDCGGNGIRGYKHTKEEIEKMRMVQNPPTVLQFDLEYNLINSWNGTSHAAKELYINKDSIKSRCEKTVSKMTPYKNSYWVYEIEYKNAYFTWEKYLKNETIVDYDSIKNHRHNNNNEIFQYSINLDLIKVWTKDELKKEKYNINYINDVCKKNKPTYLNFIWSYFLIDKEIENHVVKYTNKAIENRKRKVAKIDKETLNIIKIYNSIADASIDNGVSNSCIIKAIKKNGTSNGFLWKYA